MQLLENPKGNYRFLAGISAYSSGVIAMPGYEITRVTLQHPTPYRSGFDLIDDYLQTCGRPRSALCAVELRIPAPLSFDAFAEFNQGYRDLLEEWGLILDGQNPVARTNVAPSTNPPSEASLYGFSFTLPRETTQLPLTFVISGAGELTSSQYDASSVVRLGETSPEALAAKASCVLERIDERLSGVGMGWPTVTATNIFTVYPVATFLHTMMSKMEAAAIHGVHWYHSHPPIADLDVEMDVRSIRRELRHM
jgi:hypothetical protein